MAATKLGDIISYKRLYMQFQDSAGYLVNLTLDNPKNVDEGDFDDLEEQSEVIETVMETIIENNIFHNKGNDLVTIVDARIIDHSSTDVMDVTETEVIE